MITKEQPEMPKIPQTLKLPRDSLFPTLCSKLLAVSTDEEDNVLVPVVLSSDVVDCKDSADVTESDAVYRQNTRENT